MRFEFCSAGPHTFRLTVESVGVSGMLKVTCERTNMVRDEQKKVDEFEVPSELFHEACETVGAWLHHSQRGHFR